MNPSSSSSLLWNEENEDGPRKRNAAISRGIRTDRRTVPLGYLSRCASRSQGVSFWDLMILAACAEAGVEILCSERHSRPRDQVAEGYVTEIFRKFSVNGRAGLTSLWLGHQPSAGAAARLAKVLFSGQVARGTPAGMAECAWTFG